MNEELKQQMRADFDEFKQRNNVTGGDSLLWRMWSDGYVTALNRRVAAPTDAKPASPGLVDALNTVLWLYRRLPRGYGRVQHVDRTVATLARAVGADVDAYLAERDGAQSVRDAAQPDVRQSPWYIAACKMGNSFYNMAQAGDVSDAWKEVARERVVEWDESRKSLALIQSPSVRDAAPAAGPAFKERRRFEERG